MCANALVLPNIFIRNVLKNGLKSAKGQIVKFATVIGKKRQVVNVVPSLLYFLDHLFLPFTRWFYIATSIKITILSCLLCFCLYLSTRHFFACGCFWDFGRQYTGVVELQYGLFFFLHSLLYCNGPVG